MIRCFIYIFRPPLPLLYVKFSTILLLTPPHFHPPPNYPTPTPPHSLLLSPHHTPSICINHAEIVLQSTKQEAENGGIYMFPIIRGCEWLNLHVRHGNKGVSMDTYVYLDIFLLKRNIVIQNTCCTTYSLSYVYQYNK